MFIFHLVFHMAFWLLSVVFALQLWSIRKEQRQLHKKEFLLYKRQIDKNVDDEYKDRKIDKRLNIIESEVRKLFEILKRFRDEGHS